MLKEKTGESGTLGVSCVTKPWISHDLTVISTPWGYGWLTSWLGLARGPEGTSVMSLMPDNALMKLPGAGGERF